MEQTWFDIISDPHHVFADIIMNTVYEVFIIFILYKLMYKRIYAHMWKSSQRKMERELKAAEAKRRGETETET